MRRLLARWYPPLLAILAAAVSLAVYSRLPDRMPTHFDVDGAANGWSPRIVGAFLAPVLILVVWGMLRIAPTLDPRRENYRKFGGAYDITVGAVLVLLCVTHFFMLALALGYPVPMRRILPIMVGALFAVMGNVLPRARSNFMYGIRTPWTLSSDRVWARTHRLGGYTMTLAGVIMIAIGLFAPAAFSTPLLIGATTAALLIPVVYSYFAWKQETQP